MFKKIQTTKVYAQIAQQIQTLIAQGKLKHGDRLPPEHELAEKMGVSRPPLREALAALEIIGVIESRGGKGNVVRNSSEFVSYQARFRELENQESPFDVLEVRKINEVHIAGLAAERATKEDISVIQGSLNKLKNAIRTGRIPEAMEADSEFHINIAKGAHNAILLSITTYLTEGMKEKLWMKLTEKTWSLPGLREKYTNQHYKVLNAIRNKNSNEASENMYNHIVSVQEDLFRE